MRKKPKLNFSLVYQPLELLKEFLRKAPREKKKDTPKAKRKTL